MHSVEPQARALGQCWPCSSCHVPIRASLLQMRQMLHLGVRRLALGHIA